MNRSMNRAGLESRPSESEACWHALSNAADIDTPALIVYPARIAENIRRMIAIAGNPGRLWPHVKTHKMSAVVRLQLQQGIAQFKCATLAEAEMAGVAGASAVLLAQQPVGPKIGKLIALARRFPLIRWTTIVDDFEIAKQISAATQACADQPIHVELLLDLDVGMGRTGIALGPAALELCHRISQLPGQLLSGLHAYDGHIHDCDPVARQAACEAAMAPAIALRRRLLGEGLPMERLIAGGTPTMACHAQHAERQLSPGTCLLWDAGYAHNFPDLDFLPAAVVMSRVISKPDAGRVCLDLGHKAVAADAPDPRVSWLNLPGAATVMHSEEHWTIATPHAHRIQIGDVIYGIPWHICPTCALYPKAIVAENGHATATWPIDARDRI